MNILHTRSRALLCSGAVLALACGSVAAADPGGPSHRTVYQQRQPDGTLLLTDRIPYGGEDNVLEQTWTFPAEDPAVAAARRAELRAAHDAVNERLNRLVMHRERVDAELAMERMRLASPPLVMVPAAAHPPGARGGHRR
ncbi:hypothetical protein [Caldimonas tepidiphila]|uniref:hypothetical protein n=1 Tax=Caldimonas tepidiphila TaxID=2315841 RepID=UPI000E5C24E0|nr:hypothetical protein [Caldimonas tepidiphila]